VLEQHLIQLKIRALVLLPDTREDRQAGVGRCVSFSGVEGSKSDPNSPSSFGGCSAALPQYSVFPA